MALNSGGQGVGVLVAARHGLAGSLANGGVGSPPARRGDSASGDEGFHTQGTGGHTGMYWMTGGIYPRCTSGSVLWTGAVGLMDAEGGCLARRTIQTMGGWGCVSMLVRYGPPVGKRSTLGWA